MRHKFYNIKLGRKISIYYITMSLIPFVIFALISGALFFSRSKKSTIAHTEQITNQVTHSIDIYIKSIDSIADFIIRDLNTLYKEDPNPESQKIKMEQQLANFSRSFPEIAGILLVTDKDFISTGMKRISRDPFQEESWYIKALNNPDKMSLISVTTGRNISINESYSADNVFSLVKVVTEPNTGKNLGVLLIDVHHDIIKDSIENVTIGEKGFVFILDENDEVVYAPPSGIVYRVNPKWGKQSKDTVSANILGEKYQIRFEYSKYTGWKTVAVFSEDEIMQNVNSMLFLTIAAIIIVLILMIFISVKLAETVTKPVSKLQVLMKKAESGDLDVRFNSLYNDEIGNLGRSFNHMVERISRLIEQVTTEQKNKRDAELKILREQIKPHFLYNTLDSISWMAREYDADDIVKLVDALTSMFRIGLSQGKDYISVKEEICHVSNYLYIQKIRYKESLDYEINISEETHTKMIPKLILQPLVENAIYHGIKQKREQGKIVIAGFLIDNILTFSVTDSGAGIEKEKLKNLQKALKNPIEEKDNTSFGMFYIAKRLRLAYGDKHSINIDSEFGKGTSVIITIEFD